MFCENCGKQIDDDAKFCEYCGANINDDTTSTDKVVNTIALSKKSKKKPIIIVVILLFVLIVAGIAAYLTYEQIQIKHGADEILSLMENGSGDEFNLSLIHI